jgi:hypothetical protein
MTSRLIDEGSESRMTNVDTRLAAESGCPSCGSAVTRADDGQNNNDRREPVTERVMSCTESTRFDAVPSEFVSVPEWCRRVGCSLDSGYRAARRHEIPGQFRVGRLVRINWAAFLAATAAAPEAVP